MFILLFNFEEVQVTNFFSYKCFCVIVKKKKNFAQPNITKIFSYFFLDILWL